MLNQVICYNNIELPISIGRLQSILTLANTSNMRIQFRMEITT